MALLGGAEFVLALGEVTPLPFTRFAGQILDWRKKEGNSFSENISISGYTSVLISSTSKMSLL